MDCQGKDDRERAVSQLLWSHEGREEWFSLGENHERRRGFGLNQLRNRPSGHHTREGIGLKHGEPDGRRPALQAAMHREQI
jgi:hypothetical protein